MSFKDQINFQDAIALGLKRAQESEQIKKEVHELLYELNAAISKILNKDFLLFDLSGPDVKQLSPMQFNFNNYSFPITVKFKETELSCESIFEIVHSINFILGSPYFGDYIRANFQKG